MTQEKAMTEARKIANEKHIPMVVVYAPIDNVEDSTGPYGYCPIASVNILFKYAERIAYFGFDK